MHNFSENTIHYFYWERSCTISIISANQPRKTLNYTFTSTIMDVVATVKWNLLKEDYIKGIRLVTKGYQFAKSNTRDKSYNINASTKQPIKTTNSITIFDFFIIALCIVKCRIYGRVGSLLGVKNKECGILI